MLPVDSVLLVVLKDLSESVASGFILLRSLTLFSSSAFFFVRFPGSSGTLFFCLWGFVLLFHNALGCVAPVEVTNLGTPRQGMFILHPASVGPFRHSLPFWQ